MSEISMNGAQQLRANGVTPSLVQVVRTEAGATGSAGNLYSSNYLMDIFYNAARPTGLSFGRLVAEGLVGRLHRW